LVLPYPGVIVWIFADFDLLRSILSAFLGSTLVMVLPKIEGPDSERLRKFSGHLVICQKNDFLNLGYQV
jgi:hypothetical protein